MTLEIRQHFVNGMTWSATTQVKRGAVVVPVNDLMRLPDDEAILMIRSMIETAQYAYACDRADYILSSNITGRYWYLSVLNHLADTEDLLRKFAERDSDIAEALALIEKAKAEKQARDNGKSTAKQMRSDARKRYDSLFVEVGRRDGFFCASCGHAGNDLQIDHIEPVAKGGTNDLSNLQLLCPPCNLTKTDKG